MRLLVFIGKCLVGFLASIGLLLVLLVIAAGYGWQEIERWRAPGPEIPEQAVLTLDLKNGVVERRSASPLARAQDGAGVPLHDTVAALEAAAQDDRVKALAVRFGRGAVGLAQAQELHAAIRAFADSGKPAWGFAETLGAGGQSATVQAYLSSAFDRVWLQPSGDWGATGFRIESPYLKNALDELGIQPRLDQRREYKGLKNRFTDTALPAPIRENQERLLDSMLTQVTGALAQHRGLDEGEVRRLIDSAPLSAERAREAGLVDALGYRDAFEGALLQAAGLERPAPDAEEPGPTLPLVAYDSLREQNLPEDAPKIAVVFGEGPVQLAESRNAPLFGDVVMGSDTLAPAILEAARDPEVSAIVLRVDSPGGSYVASDAIWEAVRKAREMGTPVVVSMGNIAASGGYFVAAPADRIYASGGTITGSIGVGSGKFVLTGLWDQVEVNFDGVQAGDNADFWSPNSDFSEAQWQRLQGFLDQTYGDFKDKVAQGRGLSAEEVEKAAQGKIWTGADARDVGLVDQLGGLAAALDGAKQLADIPAETEVQVVERPGRPDPLRALLQGALQGRVESPAAAALARIAETLRPLVDLVALLEDTPAERRLQAPITAEQVR
jgi:protease-4